MSLALLAGRFMLASEIIENGSSLTQSNNNGVTPIQIILNLLKDDQVTHANMNILLKMAFEKLYKLDTILNEVGGSLIDHFIDAKEYKDEVLLKTKDPLFDFYKPNAALFFLLLHPDQTHIAISMGEGSTNASVAFFPSSG